MRKGLPLAVLCLLACGGTPGNDAGGSASAALGPTNQSFTITLTFAPGEFVFPLDCIGEQMQFTGNLVIDVHQVQTSADALVHLDTTTTYSGNFVSLTTGNTWILGDGLVSHSTVLSSGDTLRISFGHERIPLVNTASGATIMTRLVGQLATNAAGEVKVDRITFTCIAP